MAAVILNLFTSRPGLPAAALLALRAASAAMDVAMNSRGISIEATGGKPACRRSTRLGARGRGGCSGRGGRRGLGLDGRATVALVSLVRSAG